MSEGEQLAIDDYLLVNCIATGNVSQVWEVQQQSTSQMFAMKLLLEEAIDEAEQRNTMKHEVKVGKSFEHPNIISIFDSKVTRKQAFIVMELFKAANLKSMIRSSLLNVHMRMSKLAEAATSAYGYMHEKGWIHKDIKPDNILMTKGSEVRIIDFSLASKPDSAIGRMVTKKSNIAIQGTRTYIAPELIKRERLTPKADIYSLGITFYECLTGKPPFTGTNPNALLMSHIQERPPAPSELHRNISPQADALVARMLAKKPADRHESMQEVFTEVRSINFFKIDPLEFDEQEQAAMAAKKDVTLDQRIDSRSDHAYTRKHGHQPSSKPAAKSTPPPAEKPQPARPAAPPQPAAHTPQPPMMPQQMPPGMMPPGMMPPPGVPGYPQMPGQPGMMPLGMHPPSMMPPQGMPPQGMPPGMPQPIPGQPMPPQPAASAAPPPAQAPAANTPPQSPQPPPTAPAAPPPVPAAPAEQPETEPEVPEDLDWLNVQ